MPNGMIEDHVSNAPTSTSDRRPRPTLDWLDSGWILEDPAPAENPARSLDGVEVESFLIGGGVREGLDLNGLEAASCAVWVPDFFPNEHRPFSSKWSLRISRVELSRWLSENFPGSITSSKVDWKGPTKWNFEAAFKRIQTAFREDGVKKAVPVVFATGLAATSDPHAWLAHRLRAGLEGTSQSRLRLYGSWENGAGFLGASPEALFALVGTKISSMAVAGTRTLKSMGPHVSEVGLEEFKRDPKEFNEHELVVRDLETVFTEAGVEFSRSETRVQNFGALFHLVTDFVGSILPSDAGRTRTIAEWVRAFHPTPALGTSPRDSTFKLLKEAHALSGEGVLRKNFGAPFIVKQGERVDAIVAIRQICWTRLEGDDRIHLTVGSGCGLVPASVLESEWSELQAKRAAVMRLFRLSPEQSRPVFWSLKILEALLASGVRRFVVCAGARNAPLVVALEALRSASNEKIQIIVESFFEERAAGFYGLGLARSLREPVAIVTTSGTAATELLPAMAEADFSGVPLIAVTADRPRRLRNSGAPQAIPQDQVFSAFVGRAWDLEEGDSFDDFSESDRSRPSHVNICLEEPLLADAEMNPERLADAAGAALRNLDSGGTASAARVLVGSDHSTSNAALASKLKEPRLISIVGALAPDEREPVVHFLVGHAIPCLLEGPSGLRGDSRLSTLELRSGDRQVQRLCQSGEIEHVLRLGGIPTTRVWRDLDEAGTRSQTLSISKLRFSGLGRGQFIHLPGLGEFASFLAASTSSVAKESSKAQRRWIHEDRLAFEKLEALLARRPLSEPGFVRRLSELIPKGATVYVGNSLPIRWWDLAATREKPSSVEANRGVNGIDGQLSTAFGLAAGGQSNELWILVGDLTALYDLSSPWALTRGTLSESKTKIRIVVLNNSGGRIFKRVLAKAPGGSAPFENAHTLEFKNWAAMWNLDYTRVISAAELTDFSRLADRAVIEIVPSADETALFWTELP
jgi:2-succinyl-5-enolpyruvyl-6-hydroxy-3-cyclohexene-1-carboxylate synthase